MSRYAVVGDAHTGNLRFGYYVEKTMQNVYEILKDKSLDFMVWAGDIVDKPILNPKLVDYLTWYFTRFAAVCPQFLISGNHDNTPNFNMSTIAFLQHIRNIKVIEKQPYEITPDIFAVPHFYNGYSLQKRYKVVIAHLGMANLPVTDTYVYSKEDVLRIEGFEPELILLGHLHTPIELHINKSDVVILGNICPIAWGESPEQRNIYILEDSKIIEKIPLNHIKLITAYKSSELSKDENTLIRLKLADSDEIPEHLTGNVIELQFEKEKPLRLNRGTNLEDIIMSYCKEHSVPYVGVRGLLKGVGLV